MGAATPALLAESIGEPQSTSKPQFLNAIAVSETFDPGHARGPTRKYKGANKPEQ